jgi:hypothetical protein
MTHRIDRAADVFTDCFILRRLAATQSNPVIATFQGPSPERAELSSISAHFRDNKLF